jgi:hypothetical protein
MPHNQKQAIVTFNLGTMSELTEGKGTPRIILIEIVDSRIFLTPNATIGSFGYIIPYLKPCYGDVHIENKMAQEVSCTSIKI